LLNQADGRKIETTPDTRSTGAAGIAI